MAGGLEDIEMEVLGRIRDLPLMNLIDLWGSLNLADLPDDVKGNKAMVIKQFLKHFMSDEVQNAADQGMATFILVRDYLNKHAPWPPQGNLMRKRHPLVLFCLANILLLKMTRQLRCWLSIKCWVVDRGIGQGQTPYQGPGHFSVQTGNA